MKKIIYLNMLLFMVIWQINAFTQGVAINNDNSDPDPSAMLEVKSTSQGILIPRMTKVQRDAIAGPAEGLMIYQSDNSPGFYYNSGDSGNPNWRLVGTGAGWDLNGNTGTTSNNFIGTTDNKALIFKVNNQFSGIIDPALKNTAIGVTSFASNTSGNYNAAFGYSSLSNNTTGLFNVALGYTALLNNTTGNFNTAIGARVLELNTDGYGNTASGCYALAYNGNGDNNTAYGSSSLFYNTGGINNTAVGSATLFSNSIGNYNTGIGSDALKLTTAANYNTVVGYSAGDLHDMGYNNVFVGANCDVNANGLFNIVAIGQAVICTASSQARIGNSATNSIGGYANWSNISDGRFKKDIKEEVPGVNFIMRLRPVTYHLDVAKLSETLREDHGDNINDDMRNSMAYKEDMVFSGFIAQEVEQAANELGYDFSGVDRPKNENDFYGLRYAEFVVPLVKAVQEQQKIIEGLEKQNTDLLKRIEKLEYR